jgi:hypothetical protein
MDAGGFVVIRVSLGHLADSTGNFGMLLTDICRSEYSLQLASPEREGT